MDQQIPKMDKKSKDAKNKIKIHLNSSNINKFTKKPSSRAGIPRFGFLKHLAVIEEQKISPGDGLGLEIAKIFINRNLHVGANMEHKSVHFSGYRAFPKMII